MNWGSSLNFTCQSIWHRCSWWKEGIFSWFVCSRLLVWRSRAFYHWCTYPISTALLRLTCAWRRCWYVSIGDVYGRITTFRLISTWFLPNIYFPRKEMIQHDYFLENIRTRSSSLVWKRSTILPEISGYLLLLLLIINVFDLDPMCCLVSCYERWN